jgi:hypothetical protein
LLLAFTCRAADLKDLRAGTFVELKYTTEQPDPTDKGQFARQGWNKIVYDPDAKRVLLYDRWVDKKHGGWTIYGNCLFGFDPEAGKLAPIKVDNWTKMEPKGGGYRTLALPENDTEPTPCPRHVYHAFEYVPGLRAVFICNGANQTVIDKTGKLVGHDECDGAWKLDLKTNKAGGGSGEPVGGSSAKWTRIKADGCPPNRLDDGMAYCPDINCLVYTGANGQLWLFDVVENTWRKAKNSPPPRTSMGRTIFYDSVRKRMIIAGGGALDAWAKGKALEFREVYAFDPKEETVKRLADAPTALYSSHLAHDTHLDLFFAAAVFNKNEQPSGMFAYDPRKDAWSEVKTANAIPPHKSWMGWLQLCYDAHHDCLIAKQDEKFFAFRYRHLD